MDRDRRIGRAGDTRARTTLVQLAWSWLRYQPGSALAAWYVSASARWQGVRAGSPSSRWRQAADRAVALRRDRVGAGPRHTERSIEIAAGKNTPDAMGGSATVFVNGHRTCRVAGWSRPGRGHASCMRHYGAGLHRPGRM